MSVATLSTGIAGLDRILDGGFPPQRIYLLQGDPGVGKTTVGMQFLLAGRAQNERCMYIALSETREEIDGVAASHGWTLDGIHVVELSSIDQNAGLDGENTLFEPSEVELQETTRRLLAEIEKVSPERLVFDSLSELRLLAQTPLRYRRQILALKQYFVNKKTTVLLLDDRTSDPTDLQLQSLAHGVVTLEQHSPLYGADRRRLKVVKLRGRRFLSGYHDFTIRTGGLQVFPRIVAGDDPAGAKPVRLKSGVADLDELIGGGLDDGTSTLFLGPAGSGKSSIAIQYVVAAAARGECAEVFVFDERTQTILERTRGLGTELQPYLDSGTVAIHQVDPAEVGAGEFADLVRAAVGRGCRLVVIDSLNGYLHAMADEKQLTVQLHELLTFLGNAGVVSILVMAQHGLVGTMQSPTDVSYLADTVVLLRYFEAQGRIRKAISTLKKRSGAHENAIRELVLDSHGIHVGAPLEKFLGVLTGVPRFVGEDEELSRRG